MLTKILKIGSLGVVAAAALAYGFDFAAVSFSGGKQIYEDVRVDHVYTDTNKWHQIEYSRGLPTTERCIDALFPHSGYRPCWYVKKHTMVTTSTD